MEEAVDERRKAFAAAHRRHKDRQPYISASRRASSVIAKVKAEALQTTCSSLSPKSNFGAGLICISPLHSVAGSPSSSSFSPNFPNCSSPRVSPSVFADYLRSYFSVSQPKAIFPSSAEPRDRRSTTRHFTPPSSQLKFLAAASNFSFFTASGPAKVSYRMLKHLLRSGIDFLLHIFNLSTLHSFPSTCKPSSIIPIHKLKKPLDSSAFFRPISLTSCVSKLLNVSFDLVYSCFWSLIPFSLAPG